MFENKELAKRVAILEDNVCKLIELYGEHAKRLETITGGCQGDNTP